MEDDDFDPELEARSAGYSSDEIELHQVQAAREALDNGYHPDEIRQHLGYGSGYDTQQSADAHWQSTDPDLQQALLLSGTALADNPLLRSAYATSMREKDTVSPADFADTWAAGAANAVGQGADLAELGQQADALAPALPPRKDFIDAALGLGSDDPQTALRNLISHWRDTGEEPADAVMKARQDPELRSKLANPPKFTPWFKGDWIDYLATASRDAIGGVTQFASHLLPDGVTDAVNSAGNALSDLGLPIAKVGQGGIDALEAERNRVLKAQGYDNWKRTAAQIAVSLPFFSTLGLEGIPGFAAATLTGGAAQTAFNPTTATDYWTAKGQELAENVGVGAALGGALHGAFAGIGKLIGNMTPEAAESLQRVVKGMGDQDVEVLNPGADVPVSTVPASQAEFPVRPAAPKVTLSPAREDADLEGRMHVHDILDENGETLGSIQITRNEHAPEDVKPGVAHVDTMEANEGYGGPGAERAPGANTLGPRAMRELARQYFEQNPSIDTIEGFRITGARRAATAEADAAGKPIDRNVSFTRDQVMGQRFDPEATPAEKLQAIARDAKPGQSLEEAAQGEDPKTIELAQAHDAAFSVRGMLQQMMTTGAKLALDESGAVKVGPLLTQDQRDGISRWRANKDYARQMLTSFEGQKTQAVAGLQAQFDKFKLALSPHMDEFLQQKKLGPAGNVDQTFVGKFLNYVEGRSNGVTIDPNHPLAPWADVFREVNQATDKQLRMQTVGELGPRVKADLDKRLADGKITQAEYQAEYEQRAQENGVLNYNGYIKDYLAHMVKDPSAVMDQWHATGQFGSRGNLGERQGPPTIVDLLKSGHDTKFDDPGELLLHDITAKMHYSYAADMFDKAKTDGYIRWGAAKLPTDVELGTSFGQKFTGNPDMPVIKAYADPAFEKQVRRRLDQGIYSSGNVGGPIYNALLKAKNNLTALKLGVPIFHMQTIGLGMAANAMGGGLRNILKGDPEGALKYIFGSLKGEDYTAGLKANDHWVNGTDNEAINLLRDNGLNFERRQPAYERFTENPNAWSSILAGRSLKEWASDVAAGKQPTGLLWDQIKGDWSKVLGDTTGKTETDLMRYLKMGPRAAQAGVGEVQRVASTLTGPFFDHFIPTIKQGMAFRNMQDFLDHNPLADDAAKAKAARQIAQDVDNRLGELNQNTLFWSKQVKQLFNLAMISPGWSYGTLRGLSSALGYDLERQALAWNPYATTNLVGTIGAFMLSNSVYQYLSTGELPRDIQDTLHFRTGGTIPDTHGNPRKQMVMGPDGKLHSTGKNVEERGMTPTELKEYQDIGNIIASSWQSPGHAFGATGDYVLGKMAPPWQALRMLITGHDAVGHDIWADPRGPGSFVWDAIKPIFANAEDARKKGTGLNALETGVLGWRPAPRWVEDWTGYQGDEKMGMGGVYARADKEAISRARMDAAQAETTPEWAKNLPPEVAKKPSAAQRALQQFEAQGNMNGITNPRTARYLNVLRAYHKQQSDPATRLDPDIAAAQGQTLQDRLNRARNATAFDPVTGY